LKSVNSLELIETQLTDKLVSKLAKSLQVYGMGGVSERTCHGWITQAAVNVMIAPLRISIYLGKIPAKSMPPATAFPHTFWKRMANVKARDKKKTPARAADDPLPSGSFVSSR
jgi:hypothetical protein